MNAETLRRAAAKIRDETPTGGDDFREFVRAVADWFDAEAAEFDRLSAQSFAVNLLLATADGEQIDARISLGYHTLEQATAAARAYLGESA